MTHSRPFPCPHRNLDEDGCSTVVDRGQRVCYVLATCRDCGQRLEQLWQMRRGSDWRTRRHIDERRTAS